MCMVCKTLRFMAVMGIMALAGYFLTGCSTWQDYQHQQYLKNACLTAGNNAREVTQNGINDAYYYNTCVPAPQIHHPTPERLDGR